ncbi:hypothetical protein [Mixta calida]|uniref:hypothetical protein n=1 Tax=Mixta calida TaxID=665913 RepID=UPI0028A77075|nr:hypothetical protein [Mixta calida]
MTVDDLKKASGITAMSEKSAVDQNLEFFTLAVDTLLSLISRGVRKFRTKYKPHRHHFSALLSRRKIILYLHVAA